MSKKVVDPRFAEGEYEGVINQIDQKGRCPFCPDNFKYHKHPVLKKKGSWFITKQSWPYEDTKYHLLIIGDTHKETLEELTSQDMQDILFLAKWAVKEFSIEGGGLAMRFGETSYTGATVCHLHAHLVVPNLEKTVRFPFG